jgi:tRNA modification GTPase
MEDTIAALSTPAGISAIGIIRLSGKNAVSIGEKVFRGKGSISKMKSHSIALGSIIDPVDKREIDQVLLSLFRSPHSYTGEDVLEVSCHGNPLILKEILNLLLSHGARLAQPGEFTQRAYLNGKMDLTQAEAVNDLIRAHTLYARLSALNQIKGDLKGFLEKILEQVLNLLAQLEAAIDHSDLNEKFLSSEDLKKALEDILVHIDKMLQSAASGKMAREGVRIAIIGAPNVGKSSLMNALLKKDRVIVSEFAGTTRDIVEDEMNVLGIPVRLIDTAGIRDTRDEIEKKGIEKTKEIIDLADLRIFVLDASRELNPEDKELFKLLEGKKSILLLNKTDLQIKTDSDMALKEFGSYAIPISVVSQRGLEEIESAIENFYFSFGFEPGKDVLITNVRQESLLQKAGSALNKALEAVKAGLSEEFIASDVRKALAALEEITGKKFDEMVLDKIFAQFCVGK